MYMREKGITVKERQIGMAKWPVADTVAMLKQRLCLISWVYLLKKHHMGLSFVIFGHFASSDF